MAEKIDAASIADIASVAEFIGDRLGCTHPDLVARNFYQTSAMVKQDWGRPENSKATIVLIRADRYVRVTIEPITDAQCHE